MQWEFGRTLNFPLAPVHFPESQKKVPPPLLNGRRGILILFQENGGGLLSHLRSTIGAAGLNFSVRNGKRWNPGAYATLMRDMTELLPDLIRNGEKNNNSTEKSSGQLVALGFAVTGFTPAPYQRHRL